MHRLPILVPVNASVDINRHPDLTKRPTWWLNMSAHLRSIGQLHLAGVEQYLREEYNAYIDYGNFHTDIPIVVINTDSDMARLLLKWG